MSNLVKRVIGEDEDFARDLIHATNVDVVILNVLGVETPGTILCEVFTSRDLAIDYMYEWCARRHEMYAADDEEPNARTATTTQEKEAFIEAHQAHFEDFRWDLWNAMLNPSHDRNTG